MMWCVVYDNNVLSRTATYDVWCLLSRFPEETNRIESNRAVRQMLPAMDSLYCSWNTRCVCYVGECDRCILRRLTQPQQLVCILCNPATPYLRTCGYGHVHVHVHVATLQHPNIAPGSSSTCNVVLLLLRATEDFCARNLFKLITFAESGDCLRRNERVRTCFRLNWFEFLFCFRLTNRICCFSLFFSEYRQFLAYSLFLW